MKTLHKKRFAPLNDRQLLRSLYISALMALLLPPFVGGSLMVFAGFYPFPEFYLVFFKLTGAYLLAVLLLTLFRVPRFYRYIISLPKLEKDEGNIKAERLLSSLLWKLPLFITLYSVFGAFFTDLTIENMGLKEYTFFDHVLSQLGLIPVVLITSFPLFFYFIDRVGRYLGPRGITAVAIPLWAKVFLLGLVTPILIDSILIGYFYNRTGYFSIETVIIWFSLILLASGGAYLVWHSLRQGLFPLEDFTLLNNGKQQQPDAELLPLSLDEMGILTARFNDLLRQQHQLTKALQDERNYANRLIETAPVIVLVLDPQGYIQHANPFFERVTGYKLDEFKGKEWFSTFLPERDRDMIRNLFHEATHDRPTRGNINAILTREGNEREIEWNDQPVRNKEGELLSLLSIGIDVTERQALFKKTRMLQSLVEHSGQAIGWADMNTNIRYANISLRQMFGLSADDDISGYSFFDFYNGAQREQLENDVLPVVMETGQWSGEMGITTASGQIRQLLQNIFLIKDDNAVPVAVGNVMVDLSAQKQAEQARLESERRLNEAQKIAKVGSWELDVIHNKLSWSDEIFRMFELDSEQFAPSYDAFLKIVHAEDRNKVSKAYSDSLVNKNPYEIVHRLQMQDGSIKYVRETCETEFDENGAPLRSIGTVQDITALHKAELELANYRAYLETLVEERTAEVAQKNEHNAMILDAAMDGFFISDTQGRFIDSNNHYLQMLGYNRDEMLRLKISDIELIETKEEIAAHIETLMQQGRDRFDTRHRCKDGSALDVEGNVLLKTMAGKQVFFAFVHDISERKQAEQKIIDARNEAERSNAAKSEFLSRMSHELRTPMNAVLGFGQILQIDNTLKDEQRESVQEIMRAGYHLLDMINEVLDLSRIESGHLDVKLEPVAANEVIVDCVAQIRPLAEQHQININNETSVSCDILADKTRLKQVLFNLLSNAIKYNRKKGQIWIHNKIEDKCRLRISIQDSGIGIDAELQKRLFQPFERLEYARSGIEGTGIGLALSKKLIEAMGGRIGVETALGKGSTFWFELPIIRDY